MQINARPEAGHKVTRELLIEHLIGHQEAKGNVERSQRILRVAGPRYSLAQKPQLYEVSYDDIMGLGKRKRRDQLKSSDELNGSRLEGGYADLHALFRQHFEARFRPLDSISLPVKEQQVTRPPSLGEGEMSDWEGLADEAQGGPEIVELNPSLASSDELPAEELKSFMVATHAHSSSQTLTNLAE